MAGDAYDTMIRSVASGVFLGVTGAAFLEVVKTTLALLFSERSPIEAQVYEMMFYVVIFVVGLIFAGLAIRASGLRFALFALPLAGLAVFALAALVVLAGFFGLLPAPSPADGRTTWRAVATISGMIVLLLLLRLTQDDMASLARAFRRRLHRPFSWIGAHATALTLVVSTALLAAGLYFGR